MVFYELETINLFYFGYKIGIFVLRDTQIHFPGGGEIIVTVPSVPQVVNCGFDTAAEVVVTGNISLSCQSVHLKCLEVRAVGWLPEGLTASILNCLIHLSVKELGILELCQNNGGDLEFFG